MFSGKIFYTILIKTNKFAYNVYVLNHMLHYTCAKNAKKVVLIKILTKIDQ